MMRKHYNPLLAYKQSKLCNMLFAQGLNDRYGAQGLHAYGVDPGLVNTDSGNKTTGIVDFVKQVTTENATRLFRLSEQLCDIRYE